MKNFRQILCSVAVFAALSACTKDNADVVPQKDAAEQSIVPTKENSSQNVPEIVFTTTIVDGATAWSPSTAEVKAGTLVRIVMKHELKEGFDFHGFSIRDLGITDQVNRNQTKFFEVMIPHEKAGKELLVTCQFHPKHVGAKILVR